MVCSTLITVNKDIWCFLFLEEWNFPVECCRMWLWKQIIHYVFSCTFGILFLFHYSHSIYCFPVYKTGRLFATLCNNQKKNITHIECGMFGEIDVLQNKLLGAEKLFGFFFSFRCGILCAKLAGLSFSGQRLDRLVCFENIKKSEPWSIFGIK